MASQPPTSANWRPGLPAPRPALPAGGPNEPAWRQLSPGKAQTPVRVRITRLAGVLALVLVTATALIWLLLWLRPPGPACLVLVGADYADNLAVPEHPQAAVTLDRFTRLVGSSSPLSSLFRRSGRLRIARQVNSINRGDDWARGLDEAPEKTALVFFSLRAAADHKGGYLLPQDAGSAPEDRLRLEAILDRLAGLPADHNKFLILDLARARSDATVGVLNDDLARALIDLEPRIAAIPRLVVLASAGVDQSSWPTADLRTSLFASHFLAGLAGKADREGTGRLDAWTLARHVSTQTSADAARLWGATQTPLLLPREDGVRRAREIPLTFRLESAALQDAPPTDPLPDIEAAWAEYRAFASRSAAARAAVPRDWRLWQAWLVRYEQFRLAGSPAAPALLAQASQAAQRVRAGLALNLTSTADTLAMPAVAGQTALALPTPYPPFEELWEAAPADRLAMWQRLQRSSNPLLRRNLLFACLRRAAENPSRNLDRAADLARMLDDPLRPARAAEAHFLILLARDRAKRVIPTGFDDAIREALRVRLRAEEAALAVAGAGYAYAERIRPAIAGNMAHADERRQRGQDLLFASDAASWARARGLFGEANQIYDRAKGDALVLREALAARDRGLDEMPWHTAWLIDDPGTAGDEALRLSLTLLTRIGRLDELLAGDVAGLLPENASELRALAQDVQAGLTRLQLRLDAFARSCDTRESASAGRAGVALRSPGLDAEIRSRLLRKLSRLAQQGRTIAEASVAHSAQDQETMAQKRAVRHGRLALAALGPALFNSLGGPGADVFADVEPHVRRPDLGRGWSQVLRWAGDQIGQRRRLLGGRVVDRVRHARQIPDSALADLRPADRLARRLDPGQWQTMRDDAPALLRRFEVQNLLAWQATRTRRDHWFADDSELTPYFRIIASDFLRDALAVDPFGRKDVASLARQRRDLQRNSRLSLVPVAKRHLIPGDRPALTARVKPPAEFDINGEPVVWAEPGDGIEFAGGDPGRVVVNLKPGASESATVRVHSDELDRGEAAPPLEATPRPTRLGWRGYFRGQRLMAATPIDLHPAAESVRLDYARPARAGLAVRADASLFAAYGRARGGVAIVFDCSGSVGRVGNAERSRFRLATAALRRILGQVPRGTRLSLWIFGQAVSPGDTVARAEETVRRLQQPITWTGERQQIDDLVGLVENERPWNESPLTNAILRARADLLRVAGFRHLIVLSDGDDNRIARDKVANPKAEPIAELMTKSFAGSNIAVHLVGYSDAAGKPEPALEKNFAVVKRLTPPGTLTTIDRTGPLFAALEQSLRLQLDYRLTAEARPGKLPTVPVAFRQPGGEGLRLPAPLADDPDGAEPEKAGWRGEVARPGENDRWLNVPGGAGEYRLRVPRLDLERGLGLAEGDFLLLGLGPDARTCRRIVWSGEPALALRPHREAGGWRAAVVQNQLLAGRALQMLLSVEKQPDEEIPAQVRPEELWLEVRSPDARGLPVVYWGEVAGYPAPAWGIDSPGWQASAAPRLSAWWGNARGASQRSLRRGVDFKDALALRGEFAVGGEKVALDGVTVEQRWVNIKPGQREQRWCLVVRASHAPGRPIWARVTGLAGITGQEHRHYLAAGRYVGLFWLGTAEKDELTQRIAADLSGVRLVAAGAFKKETGEKHHEADFADLVTPASTPPRPEPLLVWP